LSVWQRVWNLVHGHQYTNHGTPTALLLTLYRRYDDNGQTHVWKDDTRVATALLAQGARPNVADVDGRTPFWYALSFKRSATARLLIEHGANLASTPGGDSLLIHAIDSFIDIDIVMLMLQRGADVNRADSWGTTPLGDAIFWQNGPIVRRLLRNRANPNALSKFPDFHRESTYDKCRPLEYAELRHMTRTAKLLREAGAR